MSQTVTTVTETLQLDSNRKIQVLLTLPKGSASQAAVQVFLSTSGDRQPSLSSYVYAISDPRTNEIYTTNLFQEEGSIDAATRIASILCRKLQRPVYLGLADFHLLNDGPEDIAAVIAFICAKNAESL